MFIDDFFL